MKILIQYILVLLVLLGCNGAKQNSRYNSDQVTVEKVSGNEYVLSYNGLEGETQEMILTYINSQANRLCGNMNFIASYNFEYRTSEYAKPGYSGVGGAYTSMVTEHTPFMEARIACRYGASN